MHTTCPADADGLRGTVCCNAASLSAGEDAGGYSVSVIRYQGWGLKVLLLAVDHSGCGCFWLGMMIGLTLGANCKM